MIGVLTAWMVVTGCLLVGLVPPPAYAVTIYSYMDDQGNLHATDSPDTIPEKYRAKVRTHEQPDPPVVPPSKLESMKQAVAETVKGFGLTLPAMQLPTMQIGSIEFSGNNSTQSRILTYAGAAAIVLLLMMYFSKSQLVRLLGLSLLFVLVIGTPLLLYVSSDGPADILQKKGIAAGQAQKDRLKPAGQ